jgi:hypothetical protein
MRYSNAVCRWRPIPSCSKHAPPTPRRAWRWGASRRRAVFVAPADTRASGTRARKRTVVAYASGWASLDAAVEQKRADAAFLLADQADCDSLVALARASGARMVHVTRGHAGPFARMLASSGMTAAAVDAPAIDARGAS